MIKNFKNYKKIHRHVLIADENEIEGEEGVKWVQDNFLVAVNGLFKKVSAELFICYLLVFIVLLFGQGA